ncbi:MAG: ABC transporter substrate-binding protein [Thainema sp.]
MFRLPQLLKQILLVAMPLLLVIACSGRQTIDSQPVQPENGRVVEHALGETVVPDSPERVVVLAQSALDSAIALGTKPIGSTYAGFPQRSDYGDFPDYLANKTAGIKNVGHAAQPNLETILQLNPDLILSSVDDHQQLFGALSQIAPTVLVENRADALLNYAEALGKTEQAEQLLQDYQARIQAFRQQMGERLNTTTVSVLRFRPDQVRLYMKDSFCGYVLEQVGLPRPEAQNKDKFYETVSIEAIPAMDGDVIFYFQDNPQDSMAQQIMNHPLWNQLDAVQRGRVYQVPFDTWFLGNGILAANAVLDDLFKYLTDAEPTNGQT